MLMSRIRITSFRCFFVKTNITQSLMMRNGITDIPYIYLHIYSADTAYGAKFFSTSRRDSLQ